APQSPQHEHLSSLHPTTITESISTVIPTNTPLRQYSMRARIAQSSALPTTADEPASPFRDDSQGEACPTVFGLKARQDRANIIKSFTLPHDSTPRVTSLAADEGSMQQQLNELTNLCTRLQRQHIEMASKITAQDLEIASLKARIQMLEDKNRRVAGPFGEDATIKGRSLETGEEAGVDKSTKRGSNDTKELVNVLTSLDAENILTSGVVQMVSIPPAAEVSTMEEQMIREDQRMSEQIARDAEIVRIYAEEELQMMIDGLDRNNETIAKYLQEYQQFVVDFSIRERIELINDLLIPVEDVYMEALQVRHLIIDWEIHTEGKKEYWKIIRLGGHTTVYKFFVDMLRQLDREDLSQLWTLVKETLSIRQATTDKEKELWVELKRLFELDVKDQL
nr:hypothetical protein [Tanacetum cinerariifolium]